MPTSFDMAVLAATGGPHTDEKKSSDNMAEAVAADFRCAYKMQV